ncbi:MAG: DUF1698 domain-containing protein [Phycisphaeraceae bacterium]|nr:DUF1698 domain-containing protein [Phycisphaeraceae bacterium]
MVELQERPALSASEHRVGDLVLRQPASPLDWPDLENLDDSRVLQARIDRIPLWHHQYELPGGVWTKGPFRPADRLHRIGLPERLDGMTVLDVGAWDGFYTFECERRGAQVTSADTWNPEHFVTSEGYAVAHRVLRSKAKPIRVSVHDLDPAVHGKFDLVLFLGVLYHLTNPFEALQRLRAVTKKTLIVETASDMRLANGPALGFYSGSELASDDTNWFAPNAKALVGMCRAAGFREARLHWQLSLSRAIGRAAYRLVRYGANPITSFNRNRIVVHANV